MLQGGERRELVGTDYVVYPTEDSVSLPLPGVSTVDSSPTLPEEFQAEEKEMKDSMKEMERENTKLDEEDARVSLRFKNLQGFVHDEVVSFARDVTKMNTEDTDAIDAVVPTQGEEGEEGPPGLDGYDGVDGLVSTTYDTTICL